MSEERTRSNKTGKQAANVSVVPADIRVNGEIYYPKAKSKGL